MTDLKITVDDETLAAYRRYAEEHGVSLDEAIRRGLAHWIAKDSDSWSAQWERLAKEAKGSSRGKRWRREDLYDV